MQSILDRVKKCDTLLSEIENKLLDEEHKEREAFQLKLLREVMNMQA